ncbi:MAG TPA: hypothetical protein VE869_13770 [Gemmatimonas sp.]|nr:hypothetical protein [Gemmatimonas sp.]
MQKVIDAEKCEAMTYIIIDPPVGPLSLPSELNKWRDELIKMQRRYRDDAKALETVLSCIEQVDEWIASAVTGLKDDS